MEVRITNSTDLAPSDIIRNRKAKLYKIETYHGDKNTFKISPYPRKAGEENPSYIIISRDTLVKKEWDKMDKNNIKIDEDIPAEAVTEGGGEDGEEGASLFIKEDKQNKEESIDF